MKMFTTQFKTIKNHRVEIPETLFNATNMRRKITVGGFRDSFKKKHLIIS